LPGQSFPLSFLVFTQDVVCTMANKHLACWDGMNKDYCEVMATIVDYSMAIITLHNLYTMWSYWPTPPDALSVLQE
jgi:hypothetical protein